MPATETPLNTPPVPPPPEPQKPPTVVTRRYGELDHADLVHLLDSLDDDRARSRLRESVYLSIIFYLALAWLLIYGPKYVFHPGTIVPSAASIREKQRLTELEMQKDVSKLATPKPPKIAPKLDQKTMQQLQAMQRANEAAKAAPPAPAPQPQQQPAQAAPPVQAQAAPPPPAPVQTPQPQPRPAPAVSSIPDAPRPNVAPAPSVGQGMEAAANAAVRPRLGGNTGIAGPAARVGQQSANAGYEILSDTRGVDFTEYIKRLLRMVKGQWLPLIPEECSPPLSKEGTTLIRFTIEPNGVVSAMNLDDSTHDRAIDKAAWGAITAVGQFPPLPGAFKGPNLELRLQFVISRNATDTN